VSPLISLLQESLYRHLSDLGTQELYGSARSGTKFLIHDYLTEVETSLQHLAGMPERSFPKKEKLKGFRQAERVFGRPALMLSGGGAFGIYHLGVVKALWEQGLLPRIISGSSMGAIVAAGVCARDETELAAFFAHPEHLYRTAFRWQRPSKLLSERTLCDQDQLLHHIVRNVGDLTFLEAYKRSGRMLSITVSPNRARQKPRLLNHITTPELTLAHAVLASCALPVLYPPVRLQRQTVQGQRVPYAPDETWIDGSVCSDLPKMRLARLANVNQFIVSQANPHVIPFIPPPKPRPLVPPARQALFAMAKANAVELLTFVRQTSQGLFWPPVLDHLVALLRQEYLGDLTIHLPFKPLLYRKLLSNPSLEEVQHYIRLGEQAVWPHLCRLRDRTLVSRTMQEIVATLSQSGADPSGTSDQSA